MKKFLICHRGALGDFILTWPAINCLRQTLPTHHFLGIGRPEYMRLAVSKGLLDAYRDVESARFLDFFTGATLPEEIGTPQGGVLWLSDAEAVAALLRRSATLPVVVIAPFPKQEIHVSEYYHTVLRSYFSIDFTDNLTLNSLLNVRKEDSFILIHPGSGSLKKNYAPHFYLHLEEELRRLGHRKIGFILGPAETGNISALFAGRWIFRPRDTLELADLLTGCYLYIGNDSGVTHLAGITGVRTIALYKVTDPAVWGALGEEVVHLRAPDEKSAMKQIRSYLVSV